MLGKCQEPRWKQSSQLAHQGPCTVLCASKEDSFQRWPYVYNIACGLLRKKNPQDLEWENLGSLSPQSFPSTFFSFISSLGVSWGMCLSLGFPCASWKLHITAAALSHGAYFSREKWDTAVKVPGKLSHYIRKCRLWLEICNLESWGVAKDSSIGMTYFSLLIPLRAVKLSGESTQSEVPVISNCNIPYL